MGVGALIANGSQTLKGSCALFVKQAIVMREERILLKAILLWIHPKLRYLISLKIRKKSPNRLVSKVTIPLSNLFHL